MEANNTPQEPPEEPAEDLANEADRKFNDLLEDLQPEGKVLPPSGLDVKEKERMFADP